MRFDQIARNATASPWLRRGVIGLSAAYAMWAFGTMVAPPDPPRPGLDAAWQFLLTFGHVNHLQWGRDINFTLGPLGYLIAGAYFPAARSAVVYSMLAPCLVIALTLLVARRATGVLRRIAVPITVLLVSPLMTMVLWAVLAFGWLASERKLLDPRVALTAGAFTALAALTKIDVLLEFAILYVASTTFARSPALDIGRAFLLFAAGFTGIFFLGFNASWLTTAAELAGFAVAAAVTALAYAKIEGLDPRTSIRSMLVPGAAGWTLAAVTTMVAEPNARTFVTYSFELLRGYSSAMSFAGPPWIALEAVLLGAAFFVTLRAVRGEMRGYAVGLALVVFLAFKHGFVRADGHSLGFFAATAVAAAVIFALTQGSVWSWGAGAVAAVAVVSMVPVADTFHIGPMFSRVTDVRGAVRNTQRAFIELVSNEDAGAGLTGLSLPDSLRAALRPGPLTALTWEAEIPYANGLASAFAPIPQLYTAYTPRLDFAVRDWFLGRHAPQNVLYSAASIDGRYAFADAPAGTVALWCRYRWAADGNIGGAGYALLELGPGRCGVPQTVLRGRVGWDERFILPAVPRGQILTVHANIHRNLAGMIADVLWRLDPVTIRIGDAYGAAGEYRILPNDAGDGILLQPHVGGLTDVRALFSDGLAAGPLTVSFHTAQPAFYASTSSVEVTALSRVVPASPSGH